MQNDMDRRLGIAKYNIQALKESIKVVHGLGTAEKIYIDEVIQIMLDLKEYLSNPKADE